MSDRLYSWWERDCERRRQAAIKQTPLPWDGASWVIMVNFFAVAGMGDARIRVVNILGAPIVEKMLELWPKRETWSNRL